MAAVKMQAGRQASRSCRNACSPLSSQLRCLHPPVVEVAEWLTVIKHLLIIGYPTADHRGVV